MIASREKELLVVTSAYIGVYRWGIPRPVWDRRVSIQSLTGCMLTPQIIGVLTANNLKIFPRMPHEPTYTVELPTHHKPLGVLLHSDTPLEAVVWTHTGKLLFIVLPDQRTQTVSVSDAPIVCASRYGNEGLIVIDTQGNAVQLHRKGIVHRWNDSPAGVSALAVHPSQPWILSAGLDGLLRVYNLQSRRLYWAAAGHKLDILGADYIDTERVLSVANDQQALVWRIPHKKPISWLRTPPLSEKIVFQRSLDQTLWLATVDAMHQFDADALAWRTTKITLPANINKEE